MSKFFLYGKNSFTKKQTPKIRMPKVKIKVLNMLIIGLVVFFSVGYLVQVNSLAVKGYAIKELEGKISELKQDGKNLELQVLELQSIDNIKNKVSQLQMVDTGKVDYLMPTPVVVAR